MITTLSPYYADINGGNPQHCRIYVTTLGGATATLTEANIRQGGFRYDARSTSGDVIELGAAIAAQLTLTLEAQGWMSDSSFVWYGSKLLVQVGVETNGSVVYGNIGEFVVDEADLRYDVWTITALDNLVRLDKVLTPENWADINGGSYTPLTLAEKACVACGVRVGSFTHSAIVNASMTIPPITPDTSTTWRNIVQWCAEATCSVAYCNENGDLCFGWYDTSTVESAVNQIDFERRYKSNTAYGDIEITGLLVTIQTENGEKTTSYGSAGYQLQITGNPLFTTATVANAANINGKINGFSYCPFDAQTVPYFYFQPLDACYPYIKDVVSYSVPSVITHIAYTLNGATTLEAVGKSIQNKSYQSGSAFTRSQAVVLDSVKQEISKYVSDQTKAVEQLNTLMANAMGLQKYVDANGKWFAYYAPDNQGIENASIVYTLTSEGLAWAYGWNDGNPDWQYGITADGSAILRQIFVEGIKVSNADTPFSTTIKPDGWSLNNRENTLMSASVATGEGILTLNKTIVSGYIKIGKARLYGTANGMDIVIED